MAEKGILCQEIVRYKGEPAAFDVVRVNDQSFFLDGKFLRTAGLRKDKDEWQQDVDNLEQVVQALTSCSKRIDLLRFWQRIPDCEPKFPYYKEWRDIAVIPITTFKHWWEKQVAPSVRNKIRKAQKFGVTCSEIQFDENFLRGVMEIYRQSPVRRGKAFWHYNRSIESVRAGLTADLNEAILIGAYHEDKLLGFIKLLLADRYAMIVLILDKLAERNKAPMNSMIAKAVEVCADRKIPYITYTTWRRGDQGTFQESNGFVKIRVPEYFVPLTLRGRLALALGLHKGLKGALPEQLLVWVIELRRRWYALKFRPVAELGHGKTDAAAASSN
jgi:hypothetical protein